MPKRHLCISCPSCECCAVSALQILKFSASSQKVSKVMLSCSEASKTSKDRLSTKQLAPFFLKNGMAMFGAFHHFPSAGLVFCFAVFLACSISPKRLDKASSSFCTSQADGWFFCTAILTCLLWRLIPQFLV